MAYIISSIPSTETTPFNADVTLLGANMIPVAPTTKKWCLTGTISSTDITHATYPLLRAYDGKTHLDTRPNTSIAAHATNGVHVVFDLVAAGVTFDFVAIMGTNFGSMDASFTCKPQLADDASFATNLITLGTFTPTNDRQIDFTLNGGQNRYSSARYFRLKMNATAGSNYTPQIGEIILGRRCQLISNPLRPYDTSGLISMTADFVARSGVISTYVQHRGARALRASITASTAAGAADILLWYQNANHGSRSFVWCQTPSTAPATYQLMRMRNAELGMPFVGPIERQFELAATEQGPDFLELE